MRPALSVVMPAYNAGATVIASIESVLGQTFADWELIVIDDGSTDDTVAFVSGVRDPRLRLIRAPHGGLPSLARNAATGLDLAPLVAFLDADDVWLPRKLELQLEFLAQREEVGLVHTAAHHLVGETLVPQPPRCASSEPMSSGIALAHLLRRNFIYLSSVMVRRKALDQVGWFDTDPLLRGTEDFDLWLRLCEVGTCFGYLEQPLLVYRIRPDSLCRDPSRDIPSTLRVIGKAVARKPDEYAAHDAVLRARRHVLYRNLGVLRVTRGERGGILPLARSLVLSPLSMATWAWLALSLLGRRGSLWVLNSYRSVMRTLFGPRDVGEGPVSQSGHG